MLFWLRVPPRLRLNLILNPSSVYQTSKTSRNLPAVPKLSSGLDQEPFMDKSEIMFLEADLCM